MTDHADASIAIEQHGVDTIPDQDRTGRPRDVVNIVIGSNLCLGVVIFGWLPATFGLSFWESVTAQVAGTLAGSLLVGPLAIVSLRGSRRRSPTWCSAVSRRSPRCRRRWRSTLSPRP
ncbi:hypothetical protein FHP29_08265 [Nocardioides albidus]|uniref:Uncharacterized protein n=1 Tax=Nocardioides albidus TaxID=1517589 RepID=A0A5C4W3E1_9ACTN|nr:cytosine permease [Nocardioides albidus]TNM41955.1 hypothetical protein FHP29_08265 [Nocardioides albidus]